MAKGELAWADLPGDFIFFFKFSRGCISTVA